MVEHTSLELNLGRGFKSSHWDFFTKQKCEKAILNGVKAFLHGLKLA